jgi:hypothetical protein
MGPVSLVPDWRGKEPFPTTPGHRDVSPCLQQCGTCVSLDVRVWASQ